MTRDEAFTTFKAAAVDVLAVQEDQVTIEASFAEGACELCAHVRVVGSEVSDFVAGGVEAGAE